MAPFNGITLVLIDTINNGEIDVENGNVTLEGITEGEGSYFVDPPGVLTINNGELILEGDLIIGDNGKGALVRTPAAKTFMFSFYPVIAATTFAL